MDTEAQKKKRKALGAGLSSLLRIEEPLAVLDSNISNTITDIPLTDLIPNPFQPRLDFDIASINELAESIKSQGLMQPLVARRTKNNQLEIVSGERRFRALTLLSVDTAPVIIKEDISDTRMLELALVENIQRENLNDIETSLSYQRLLFECGLSHQELSERVGKSRSSITNHLRLLKLPEAIQLYVRQSKISMGHARALLSLAGDEKLQTTLANKIISEGLSVRDIEKMVNPKVKSLEIPSKKSDIKTDFSSIINAWNEKSTVNIKLNGTSTKGKMTLEWKDEDDYNKLISTLINQ